MITTIMSYIPNNKSKILFIFDGVDEYGDNEKITSLYDDVIKPKIKDFVNCKFLLTTRLKAGLPQLFYATKYVRLLSFSPEQVDKFMRKYGIPLKVIVIVIVIEKCVFSFCFRFSSIISGLTLKKSTSLSTLVHYGYLTSMVKSNN